MSILTANVSKPFLTKEAEEVDPTSSDTQETIDLLLKEVAGIGLGLAAPQVGRSECIAVMNLVDQTGDLDKMTVCINPALILDPTGGYVYSVEGCLSVPGESYLVQRYKRCTLSFSTQDGEIHTQRLSDFPAVVAQHECDHLLGRLICDVGKLVVPPESVEYEEDNSGSCFSSDEPLSPNSTGS